MSKDSRQKEVFIRLSRYKQARDFATENRNSTITLEVAWIKSVSGEPTASCDFNGANPFGIQELVSPTGTEYFCAGYQGCTCALAAILVANAADSCFPNAFSRFHQPKG